MSDTLREMVERVQPDSHYDEPRPIPTWFVDANGCWIWTRNTAYGYGLWNRAPHRGERAHKVIWEAFNGPMPEGLQCDHLCRVKLCVNPAHIEAVTPTENNRRAMGWGGVNHRKTLCKRGHKLVPIGDHQARGGNGWRMCKECKALAAKRAQPGGEEE